MTSKLSLQIFPADGTSRAEVLDRESVIIGSGPSANIQIQDPGISAVHIMLKVGAEGDVTLVDLGSEKGTRLKGQALREPTLLAAGDEVQIGGTRIKMKLEQGSTQQPAVARDVQGKASQSEDTLRTHALKSARTASRPQEAPLSSFQSNALALGPNGNKMLNEEFSPENQPTESERELEVALFWGDTSIDVRAFRVGQSVKIGPGEECDIRLYEDIVGEGFELVTAAPGSSEPVVHVPPDGKILVYRGGEESASPGDVRLGVTDRCLVSVGVTQLILRWVRPSKHFKSGFFESVDFYFTKVLSVVFMAHLVLLIGFWITPLNNELLSEDLFKNPNAFAKLLIRAPDKDKKKFDLSGVKEGAKAKDKEGKFGKKDAKKDQADPSKKGAPIVDAKKREEDRAKIMKAGLLGALGGAEGAASNIFGPGGLGTGINNALGGLKGGAGMGDAHGVGGLGSRGTGPGGGGTALGIGGLGTKGSGHGAGGYGSIDLGGHGKGDTRIVPGRTIVQGALSKEIIGKVIRRHWNEIKYCYETELNKNPNLYGKVSVSFTIDGTGAVSDANVGETTMNNQNVENCMLTRVRRWTFPEPKGGGQVFVTYPWIFKAAGSEDE